MKDGKYFARGLVLRVGGASTLLGDIATMSCRQTQSQRGPKYQDSNQKPSDDYSGDSDNSDDSDDSYDDNLLMTLTTLMTLMTLKTLEKNMEMFFDP